MITTAAERIDNGGGKWLSYCINRFPFRVRRDWRGGVRDIGLLRGRDRALTGIRPLAVITSNRTVQNNPRNREKISSKPPRNVGGHYKKKTPHTCRLLPAAVR